MSKSISFEESIKELENIVEKLEKGDLSLEESLKHFEKGINLSKKCQELLSSAEQKIEKLAEVSDENVNE